MSPFCSSADHAALHSIAAAVAQGVEARPDAAAGTLIASLTASLGPIVQEILDLIRSGLNDLPAVLAALQASGVTLPPWVSVVVTILLAIVKPAS